MDSLKVKEEVILGEEPKKEVKKEEPKKKKPRCFHCKKKLKMTELVMICKCSHTFCLLHLNPHSHNCSFDYLKERRELIEKNNPKMCIQCIEVK
jgi:hypothetical protein